jgi:hypothetical protein
VVEVLGQTLVMLYDYAKPQQLQPVEVLCAGLLLAGESPQEELEVSVQVAAPVVE